MSFYAPIRHQNSVDPDGLALVGLGCFVEVLSYRDLCSLTESMVSELVRRENLSGQRVEVNFHDRVAQIIAVLALSHLGAGAIVSRRNNSANPGSGDIVLSDHVSPQGKQALTIDLQALLRRSLDNGSAAALEQNGCSDLAFVGTPTQIGRAHV